MTRIPKHIHLLCRGGATKTAQICITTVMILLVALHAIPAAAQDSDPRENPSIRRFSDVGNNKKDKPAANVLQDTDPNLHPDLKPEKPKSSGLWSFGFGIGVISDNTPGDYPQGRFDKMEGPGSGMVYNVTFARQIKEFDWTIGNAHLRPQLEVPFRFTLVDEKAEGLIPDFNLGIILRWQNFPWNRFVFTTMSAGTGLSYSSPIWTADKERQSTGEHRSKLKFWLPIEVTVALPRYPNYQLTAFVDHQSGGRILDKGGVDAWGLGFRIVF